MALHKPDPRFTQSTKARRNFRLALKFSLVCIGILWMIFILDTVFGLLGGSMLELYDALGQQNEVRYIGARDERAAGHMADAYARIRGCPGIVLGAQAGPGVANLVTPVAGNGMPFIAR